MPRWAAQPAARILTAVKPVLTPSAEPSHTVQPQISQQGCTGSHLQVIRHFLLAAPPRPPGGGGCGGHVCAARRGADRLSRGCCGGWAGKKRCSALGRQAALFELARH